MGIIGNIEDNIVVIYKIKSFYVTLAAGKFFPNNIHRANYHFTYSEKTEKTDSTTILPLCGIVYRKRQKIIEPCNWYVLLLLKNSFLLAL
jgi:hypothetical protein